MTGTKIRDFARVLQLKNSDGQLPIIVGGHAVNAWASYYLEEEPSLKNFLPFLSKDLDLLGTKTDLMRMAHETGWHVEYAESKMFIPSAGYILMPMSEGKPVKVEVLKRIYGAIPGMIQDNALELVVDGLHIRVPDPLTLMESKLENAVNLDQKKAGAERQDEKHLRMMLLVARAYLRGNVANLHKEKITGKDCLTLLETFLAAALSSTAKKSVEMYGIHWSEGLPLDELAKSKNPKLRNFFEKRLSRCFPELQKRRKPRSPV